ncbi:MAG: DUF1566 domain-containing protein [Epsilonproteobacteria bacterium]|nr:DUF1566 domain-containing protein [Campylobacterota bacterium]
MRVILLLLIGFSLLLEADLLRDDTKEVVLDTTTNLMWQDNNETNSTTMNWSDAINYCESLTLGGYSDWHLPNLNELYSLPNRAKYNPAMDMGFKYLAASVYWSATTDASDTGFAWYVYFDLGHAHWYHKSNFHYVRCVRASDN